VRFYDLSNKVIGFAIEVHRHLGPGLLESTYEQCLEHELALQSIEFKLQHPVPVFYKDVHVNCDYRIDVLVENDLILEL
jgi:GxxExxY protein